MLALVLKVLYSSFFFFLHCRVIQKDTGLGLKWSQIKLKNNCWVTMAVSKVKMHNNNFSDANLTYSVIDGFSQNIRKRFWSFYILVVISLLKTYCKSKLTWLSRVKLKNRKFWFNKQIDSLIIVLLNFDVAISCCQVSPGSGFCPEDLHQYIRVDRFSPFFHISDG